MRAHVILLPSPGLSAFREKMAACEQCSLQLSVVPEDIYIKFCPILAALKETVDFIVP